MKFFAIAALMGVMVQGITLRDEDDDNSSNALQEAGMRESDIFSSQVDDFMSRAKEAVSNSKSASRKAAFERVKAQSPTHSINYLEVPEKKKEMTDE